MNKRLWQEFGGRIRLFTANAAWTCCVPFTIALLACLYPFGIICDWAEDETERFYDAKK